MAHSDAYKGLSKPLLAALRVVLVSPKSSANVGAVLRAAANFEAGGVWVVDPRCDTSQEGEVGKVACESPLLHSMQVVPSLHDALADTHCSVGFTRRAGGGRRTHRSLRWMLQEAHAPLLATSLLGAAPGSSNSLDGRSEAGAPPVTALVFGREESGLQDSELLLCSHACAIPTGRPVPSMNLSHAVAVVLSQCFDLALHQGSGITALEAGKCATPGGCPRNFNACVVASVWGPATATHM